MVATDEQGLRGTLGVTVTVTELNEGPVVSGTATFTINEYQDLSNASYTARDPEATGGGTTTIRWSTSGRGRGDFTIDRGAGVLTFRTPPDYERPADSNRENVYEVTVRAYDGRNYGDFGGDRHGAGGQRAAGNHRQRHLQLPGKRHFSPLHLPGQRPRGG